MTNELFVLYVLLIVLALLASVRPGGAPPDEDSGPASLPSGSEQPLAPGPR
jgi:hypothetical protein